MKIIERYIHVVTKHLNEKERYEVEEELQAVISDMLPEDYNEEDVQKVLYKLGNPAVLAEKYQDKPRYLISPSIYNNYLYVLKLVLVIMLCIAPVAAFVSALTDIKPANDITFFVQMITQTLTILFEGAIQAFAWVTIIFAVMDRVKCPYLRWPYTGEEWTIKDLFEAPLTKRNKIDKSESVFSIIFIMIFTVIICFFPQYLGWYTRENSNWSITPLFNTEALSDFIPFLLILALLGVVLAIVKLIYQRWTKGLAIFNAVYNLYSIILTCSFLLTKNIFNIEFIEKLAIGVDKELSDILSIWHYSSWGIIAFIVVVVGIVDIVQGFRKSR